MNIYNPPINANVRAVSGTISANQNYVDVAHGLGVTPAGYVVTPTNDYAKQGNIGVDTAGVDATYVRVSFPEGITQPVDSTFNLVSVV